jgi:DNA polymerase-1
MIAAFRADEDIHARTAAEVYGVPFGEVTSQMRSASKAVNFGIVYGISDFALAKNIGVTRAEAREFMNRYFERYPGVKAYMESSVQEGKERGYALTLMGRRRYLPELMSSNFNVRSFGERAAMNMPLQGSSADIIKLAMIGVAKKLQDGGYKARLVLQVHDELLIDCPHSEQEEVSKILKTEMENAVSLAVPLTVDVGIGTSWYDAK